MKLRNIALTCALAALALPAFAAGTGQKAGKWQTTIEVEMPGMPMKMPAMTNTTCITKEDVENPERNLPKGDRPGQQSNCKVSDYKIDGNKVTWSIKCEGKTPMTGNGEMTYTSDSSSGWMKMHVGEQDMTMKYTGKYLGACEK